MGRRPGGRTHLRDGSGGGGKLTEALRWWLDNGDQWRAAKAKAEADDTDIPEALDPPEILEGFGVWFDDFWRLSTERQIGFGYGQIPQSEIDRHVEGWGYEDADTFEFCIRRMDEVYLMKANKTEETQTSGSPRDAFRAATSGRRRK